MNNIIEFLTLFGENGLMLIAVAAVGFVISLVTGIVAMIFEKFAHPWAAGCIVLAIIDTFWTMIQYAGA